MNDQVKPSAPQRDGSIPRLDTVSDLKTILQLGEAKVRALIHSGELPAMRLGAEWRVSSDDLEAFLEARRATARTRTASDRETR